MREDALLQVPRGRLTMGDYRAMCDRDPIRGALCEHLGLVNHFERLFGPDRGE